MGFRRAWLEAWAQTRARMPERFTNRVHITGPDVHASRLESGGEPLRVIQPYERWQKVIVLGGKPVLRQCPECAALVQDEYGRIRHAEWHEELARLIQDALDGGPAGEEAPAVDARTGGQFTEEHGAEWVG